jgi:hypothetical protein
MEKTRSTSEAIRLLEDKRAWLVAMGKRIAIGLCKRDGGTTNSRTLRQEMQARGLFDDYKGGFFWMSAVFCDDGIFTWDGTKTSYRDRANNIHEREIRNWKLASPDVTTEYVPLPCRPPTKMDCPQLNLLDRANDFLPPKKREGEPSK